MSSSNKRLEPAFVAEPSVPSNSIKSPAFAEPSVASNCIPSALLSERRLPVIEVSPPIVAVLQCCSQSCNTT